MITAAKTTFEIALDRVMQEEGGFVDDPDDPGGATNHGITLAALTQWERRPVSIAELQYISTADAMKFYRDTFWWPMQLASIPVPTNIALFDAAVLFGITGATVCAQRVAASLGFAGVKVDGHMGTITVQALNGISPGNFISAFRAQLKSRIADIILKRPTSEKYRKGWETRVDKLQNLVP